MTSLDMKTTGRFPAAAIAKAAKAVKEAIEADRKKNKDVVFKKYRNYHRFNWRKFSFEKANRTDEQIRKYLRSSYNFELIKAESQFEHQYDRVIRLLSIASGAPLSGELIITAQDFHSLSNFYKPTKRKK